MEIALLGTAHISSIPNFSQTCCDSLQNKQNNPVSLNGQMQAMPILWSVLVSCSSAKEVQKEGDISEKIFRCPLHQRCGCPLILHMKRTPSSLSLECTGKKNALARCHQTKKPRLKEAMDVPNYIQLRLAVMMALQLLSPKGKVQPGLELSVRSFVSSRRKRLSVP